MKNNINVVLSAFALWFILFGKDGITAFGTGMVLVVCISFVSAVCWKINKEQKGFNLYMQEILYQSSISYGLLIILSALREFISIGSIFDVHIAKFDFMSKNFQKPDIGFIFAGIMLCIVIIITKVSNIFEVSWWIIIPSIILFYPININNLPSIINIIISLIVVIFLMSSIKEQLKFALVPYGFKGLPIDLVSLGLVYIALGFL